MNMNEMQTVCLSIGPSYTQAKLKQYSGSVADNKVAKGACWTDKYSNDALVSLNYYCKLLQQIFYTS